MVLAEKPILGLRAGRNKVDFQSINISPAMGIAKATN